jgi:hypothetical protein
MSLPEKQQISPSKSLGATQCAIRKLPYSIPSQQGFKKSIANEFRTTEAATTPLIAAIPAISTSVPHIGAH